MVLRGSESLISSKVHCSLDHYEGGVTQGSRHCPLLFGWPSDTFHQLAVFIITNPFAFPKISLDLRPMKFIKNSEDFQAYLFSLCEQTVKYPKFKKISKP